jgi:type IV secretory pathway VirB3-like protein
MSDRGTSDQLFLGITRPAIVRHTGVPLTGFLLVVGGCAFVFDLTARYSLLWSSAGCGSALVVLTVVLRVLTSREPHWFRIGVVWARTRLPVLLSRPSRRFGGTTFSPLPVDLRRNRAELRDYAG